ncbi:MAG: hypothetical protein RI957_1434 [Verrucomicrobiota bacterium]|jgi:hypothetical protein
MNRSLFSLFALSAIAHAAPDDILRFTNGDQLHGKYQGMGDGNAILWTRPDLATQISLKSENVRHIVLRGATPTTDACSFAFVTLQNGDQIPGEVLSFDEKNTRIRSHVVGEIDLPSESISAINPNPFGGKLQYAGPFSADGWEVYKPEDRDPKASAKKKSESETSADDKKESKAADKKDEVSWQHSGSSWYHVKGMHVLARKNCLDESTLLRFRLAWRERLNVNIALNADFALPPELKKDEENEGKKAGVAARQPMMFFNGMPSNHSLSFGNALVLSVYQSYFSLTRCGYDTNGQVINQRMLQTQSGVQLPESGEATIEVRCNRAKGLLMLFVNGQYAAQWEDIDSLKPEAERKEDEGVPPLGRGFAIQCNNPLRVSEVVISEWSGIKDSAYSLSHEKRDIILLSNGTDRYSGEIIEIKDNKVIFKSAYSELAIPLTEISEIVFAKKQQTESKEAAEGTITARFYPTGKISGQAQASSALALKLNHPLAKQLELQLHHAVSLEFSDENPFLEIMDHNQDIQLTPDK